MRSQRKGPLGRDAARDEGGERREQREETRRVGKRSRLPVSIDPPRRSRAHLVFHPSSVAISLYHEKVKEEEGKENENERWAEREPSYTARLVDTIPRNAATKCNVGSLY